jgi:hypothetical protein
MDHPFVSRGCPDLVRLPSVILGDDFTEALENFLGVVDLCDLVD